MFRSVIASLIMVLPMPAWPQSSFQSVADLERFSEFYYLHPYPERVSDAINQAAVFELAWKPETEASTLAFFSCLFHRYPERSGQWRADMQGLSVRDQQLFNQLASRRPISLFAQVKPSATLNDMYWSCYFATGERRYLRAITNSLNYLGERKQQGRFLMAAAAQWSLAHYARSHLAVRAWLIELSQHRNARWQALANDMLKTPATTFSKRTSDVLRAQREAGVWRNDRPESAFSWPW